MGEYFRGWRRKLGLITLGLACALTLGWLRSCYKRDRIVFQDYTSLIGIKDRIENGKIAGLISEKQLISLTAWEAVESINNVKIGGWMMLFDHAPVYSVPYWQITIPITLLSAYLLLSKPRQKPSAPPQDVHQ